MKNKIIAVATVAAVALSVTACGKNTPVSSVSQPASSTISSEAESVPAESAVADTKVEGPLYMATETMTYPGSDEGVVTIHKYDDQGREVYTHQIDHENNSEMVTYNELDEAGNVVKALYYSDGKLANTTVSTYDEHNNVLTKGDGDGNIYTRYEYEYDDQGRVVTEKGYVIGDGEEVLDHTTEYTYDDTHELPVKEVVTNDYGVETTERDFDSMAADGLYVETITEDVSEDKIVSHIRVEDGQTVYYNGQGSEVYTEYDEKGNTISMSGKDATMGNFEQGYANEYDEEGNLISVKTTYNGDDGYSMAYTYAPLSAESPDGVGTMTFDAAVDLPAEQ